MYFNAGSGCQAGQSEGCAGDSGTCITSTGREGNCDMTTGNAGYCGYGFVCADCRKDMEYQEVCGVVAAVCVRCPNCDGTATFQTACVGPGPLDGIEVLSGDSHHHHEEELMDVDRIVNLLRSLNEASSRSGIAWASETRAQDAPSGQDRGGHELSLMQVLTIPGVAELATEPWPLQWLMHAARTSSLGSKYVQELGPWSEKQTQQWRCGQVSQTPSARHSPTSSQEAPAALGLHRPLTHF